MKRTFIIPPVTAGLLALMSGCQPMAQLQPAGVLRDGPAAGLVAQLGPPTPMRGCSEGWRPDYLADRPAGSPYSPIRTVAVAPSAQPPAQPIAAVKAPTLPVPAGAHAPDYRWIVGRLEHDAKRDRMYVRYADASHDQHGGVLELVGIRAGAGLAHGQWARVEGHRVDPAPNETESAYRVSTIRPAPPGAAK